MTFTHPGGLSGTTGLHADGTFSLALLDERYSTTIGNLPADYSVQSIRSGSIDLTRSLLAVDAKHVPDNILVVLQHHPHNPR